MAKIRLGPRNRLSWGFQDHHHPALATDGTRLAFAAGPAGHVALYVMELDKRTVRPLTASSANHASPTFSPDGRFVYFARQSTPDDPHEIWVADVERPERNRKLLASPTLSYSQPSLSPDGQQVAMIALDTGGRSRIQLGELARDHIGKVHPLAEPGGIADAHPSWSPDGAWIAFHRYEGASGHTSHICKVRPDGRGFTPLTDGDDLCKHPAWAGDEYLVYQSTDSEGRRRLHLISSGGEPLGELTQGEMLDKHPSASIDREGAIAVAFAARLPEDRPLDPDRSFGVFVATIENARAQVKRRRTR